MPSIIQSEPAAIETISDRPAPETLDIPGELVRGWQSALRGDDTARAHWQAEEGGQWHWSETGICVRGAGTEWAAWAWSGTRSLVKSLSNVVIELTVSGKGEAAGLSFGPYKDFLAPLDSSGGTKRLQLELDAVADRWVFRVDGELQGRHWWNGAVRRTSELLENPLCFKARRAEEVRIDGLTIRNFQKPCQLSIIITCHRFLQRLRVTLRNWCLQNAETGAYEIVIVNPSSPDGTHDFLGAVARCHPHVRVRELMVDPRLALNKGTLINQAVRLSGGRWVWLTDADCLFGPDSVQRVIDHVQNSADAIYYGTRKHLTSEQTDALIVQRLDGIADFASLAAAEHPRADDCNAWGYTQIVPKRLLQQFPYRENMNHFAHSDNIFVDECRRRGLPVTPVNGLFCLHLHHPFSWYGTRSFL